MKNWEPPRSVKGVRSLLGFANFYREFISRYSELVTPLTALTRKDHQFEWTGECQAAFEMLIQRMITALALQAWNPEAEIVVKADASGYVVGGALL